MLRGMPPERIVRFRTRAILQVVGVVLAVAAVIEVVIVARHVMAWILISIFLAMALNPAVEQIQRRARMRRGWAAALTYLIALAAIAGIAASFIPTLVHQV